jgi:hypothetical protein
LKRARIAKQVTSAAVVILKTTEQRWPDLKLKLPLVTHTSEYSDQAASAVKRTPRHQ